MRALSDTDREHLRDGLVPYCSECREPVSIVLGSVFKRPEQFVILPHADAGVCPLSTILWLPA